MHRDDEETGTVGEALGAYLARNGFRIEDYEAPRVCIPFGPFTIHLPNTSGRKRIVRLHDLHHVATGYGTDWVGEGEVGAWELRAGCTNLAGWVYNGLAVLGALFRGPRRVWRAFRAARGAQTLYRLEVPYEEVLEWRLERLRTELGVPKGGLARGPQALHAHAPHPST